MSWLFFALVSPALYAATVFVDKFLIEKEIKSPFSLIAIGGGVAFLFALAIPFFGIGNFHWLNTSDALVVLLSGILVQIGTLPYIKAIQLEDASRITPLFGLIPVFVLIASFVFLGESLTGLQLVGFTLVLLGGVLLSLKELSWRAFAVRRAAKFMVLASLCFASSAVLFKFVVSANDFWSTLFYELLGTELVTLSFFLVPKLRRDIWNDMRGLRGRIWAVFVGDEIVYLIARLSGFYAYALAPVSLVSVLGETEPFFALIFGLILSIWFSRIIKEDIRKETLTLKIFSILLIFGGVWLINAV